MGDALRGLVRSSLGLVLCRSTHKLEPLGGPKSLMGLSAAPVARLRSQDTHKPEGWRHSQQLRNDFTEE